MGLPMSSKVYTAIKPDGRIPSEQAKLLRDAILQHVGKDVLITIERKRKRRSLNQNAFMHGAFFESLSDMFLHYGMDYDEATVKEIFKHQFGVKRVIELPNGSREVICASTREYTTAECEEAMEKARRHYAEYWQLPYPNESLEPRYE